MEQISSQSLQDIRESARRVLLKNYQATGRAYITPAWPHYKNQWLWDSCFHAIICAELGLMDLAKNEVRTLLVWQDERGFIPHQIFYDNYRWFDFERYFYGKKWIATPHSTVMAPPVLAQAVEAVQDSAFWKEVISGVVKFYQYFQNYRDAENILSIFTPRESGRDAAPEFDFYRPKAPKLLGFLDRALDPFWILKISWQYKKLGWDERKMMELGIFHVKDLVTHCIWVDGLYALQRMLKNLDSIELFPDIHHVIEKAEQEVVEKAWNEEDKIFYSLRWVREPGHFEQIRQLCLGSLFPLLLENIPSSLCEATLAHLKNPNEFWSPYPVPSASMSNPAFNPSRTFPIWRGPTWMNTNWFLIRGLMRHGYRAEAKEITHRSLSMVSREGLWEFYNPLTGKGMRVKDFGWSALVVTFPKLIDSSL